LNIIILLLSLMMIYFGYTMLDEVIKERKQDTENKKKLNSNESF
jgi:hypothetical protein